MLATALIKSGRTLREARRRHWLAHVQGSREEGVKLCLKDSYREKR